MHGLGMHSSIFKREKEKKKGKKERAQNRNMWQQQM